MDVLDAAGVRVMPPLGYLEFLSLISGAGAVLTDSGGIQEETTALGVRCYTLRPNTERPITISHGTNTLLGDSPDAIDAVRIEPSRSRDVHIQGWDGHAGARTAEVIAAACGAGDPEDTRWLMRRSA